MMNGLQSTFVSPVLVSPPYGTRSKIITLFGWEEALV